MKLGQIIKMALSFTISPKFEVGLTFQIRHKLTILIALNFEIMPNYESGSKFETLAQI